MVARNQQGDPQPIIEISDHLVRAVDELRALNHGEAFDITIAGNRVARFVPLEPVDPESRARAAAFILQFGTQHSTGGIGWKSLRDEGRR